MPLLALVVPAPVPSLPALRIEGKRFVDPAGREVRLRGVNLGGWLVEEIWMTPWKPRAAGEAQDSIKDNVTLWGTLERRLGRAAMLRLKEAWRANWITDADFARVRELGFNSVRLPFLDRMLDEPDAIARLKAAVAAAARNGLYTVLDLHGAPGGQSDQHHTGQEGRNQLWSGTENVKKLEVIWRRLGKEFGSDPNVAMFDLMNEPTGAPNAAMLAVVYARAIAAVRETAPTKPVLYDDGFKGFETTPHTNVGGWNQVAYSLHFYNFGAKAPGDHAAGLRDRMPKLLELQGYRDAPIYAGEFNLEPQFDPAQLKAFIGIFDRAGWSFAYWTFKAVGAGGPVGDWGIYRPRAFEPKNVMDPTADSEAELIRKIGTWRTEGMITRANIADAFARTE